ncbi:MAG TPA: hypothetical protein DIT49_07215 [Clostridiales bacterium]|nr:hypothetical protein [Clostridiales bacterium]
MQQRPGQRPAPASGAPKPPLSQFLSRVLIFLLTAALILGAVAAVVYRDQLNLDSIKRWFHYRSLVLSDSGQAESFRYDGALEDTFATLNGDLLVCSTNTLSLYSGSGTCYVSQSVSMDNPVVSTNGSQAVVYDAGGSSLYVLGQRALIWKGEDLDCILSAHLNRSGQLTVVTQASGYRGRVTVYSSDFVPLMQVNLSSAFVTDGTLSDDGKTLGIVTIGQEDGAFASTLSLYSMNTQDSGSFTPDTTCPLDNGVVLESKHTASRLWLLGDQGLTIADHQGNPTTVSWNGMHLKRYALSGRDFATVLLGKYRAGSQAQLWTIDSQGERHTLEINQQVLSLAAAGRYVAVLTGDRLDIYTSDLELYASLEGTRGARTVLLTEDGSAVLLSEETASFYVP